MSRVVPVVALVPEDVARQLETWAADPASIAALEPLADRMAKNGWQPYMVLAGSVLASAVRSGGGDPS